MLSFLRIFITTVLLGASVYAGISATGYGSTQKAAKKAALMELSNRVSANVASSLTTSTTVSNQEVTKQAKSDLAVKSNSYFQGVTYSAPLKDGAEYKVTATLSNQGIADTLDFLDKELSQDLLKLTRYKLKELLNKAHMAYALASFSSNKNSIQKRVKAQQKEVQKYLTYARVTFNITPSDATLILNNQKYEPYSTYLLAPNEYNFKITADGYFTEEGRLSFGRGETRTITKRLVEKSDVQAQVYVHVDNDQYSFSSVVNSLLLQYGVAVSPNNVATNAVIFTFDKRFKTKISGMNVYDVTVIMSVYKGANKFMVKRVKRKNVVDSNYESKVRAGVKALTKYLLQKTDMKTFIGKQSVQYDDI